MQRPRHAQGSEGETPGVTQHRRTAGHLGGVMEADLYSMKCEQCKTVDIARSVDSVEKQRSLQV